jgi:hypothetical protein
VSTGTSTLFEQVTERYLANCFGVEKKVSIATGKANDPPGKNHPKNVKIHFPIREKFA